MARRPEGPWYRKQTHSWYATVAGEQVSLDVRGPKAETEAAARSAWHKLLATSPEARPGPSTAHIEPVRRGIP